MMLAELEQELRAAALQGSDAGGPSGPIFIVGAPRTGSTILYQALVEALRLPFFANLTNRYFPQNPVLGLSLQAAWPIYGSISGESLYGKVKGLFQPSEASAIMTHWFGGGHPSETVSSAALPGRDADLKATVAAAWRLFQRPLVIKNAWNCFRIAYLADALPAAAFIWIRRDIAASAKSDLHARYVVQNDPGRWNSATPRNWSELRRLPCWMQVVENQAEFSRAIRDAVAGLGRGRSAEVWYEDFVDAPERTLRRLSGELAATVGLPVGRLPPIREEAAAPELPCREAQQIDGYLEQHRARFAGLRHKPLPADGTT